MTELFKMKHKVLVCISIISKDLGAVKRIEETTFKQQIRQLCEKLFKTTCVTDRELENYFKEFEEQKIIRRETLAGNKRKTFYIINPNKVRTENVIVIELGEKELLIHDSIAGVLLEGSWAKRYKLEGK
jgi:hypothetical protein